MAPAPSGVRQVCASVELLKRPARFSSRPRAVAALSSNSTPRGSASMAAAISAAVAGWPDSASKTPSSTQVRSICDWR